MSGSLDMQIFLFETQHERVRIEFPFDQEWYFSFNPNSGKISIIIEIVVYT